MPIYILTLAHSLHPRDYHFLGLLSVWKSSFCPHHVTQDSELVHPGLSPPPCLTPWTILMLCLSQPYPITVWNTEMKKDHDLWRTHQNSGTVLGILCAQSRCIRGVCIWDTRKHFCRALKPGESMLRGNDRLGTASFPLQQIITSPFQQSLTLSTDFLLPAPACPVVCQLGHVPKPESWGPWRSTL